MDNKHYIRLDEKTNIIKGFSDAFEEPNGTDICINEKGGLHFELNGVINPPLTTVQGIYLYRYMGGKIVAKTQEEIDAEILSLPKTTEITNTELDLIEMDYRITKLELGVK